MKRPENIREFVWKVIDTDPALKKDLQRGIVNIRALAVYIVGSYKVNLSLDSVISAIRRYPADDKNKNDSSRAFSILKSAKIRTITKMASISLKKNEETTRALSEVLVKVDFEGGEVLRVLEGAKLFKIIVDQKSFGKSEQAFGKKNIIESDQKIGMIELVYPEDVKKIPGTFSVLSGELAQNEISIIDALIISNEHIIVVSERELLKAFGVIYQLCN